MTDDQIREQVVILRCALEEVTAELRKINTRAEAAEWKRRRAEAFYPE